jgi:hypothetical protein
MMRSDAAGDSSTRRRGVAGLQTPGRSGATRAPAEGARGSSHRGVSQAPTTEPEGSGAGSSRRAGGARAPGIEERKARRRPSLIPAEQSLTFFVLSGNTSFHRAGHFLEK